MNNDIYQEFRSYRTERRQAEPYHLASHRAPRRQARCLSDRDIEQLERYIFLKSRAPHCYALKFRLTVYAGLRVGEVLNIHITDLVEPDGSISDYVTVRPSVGKGGKGRRIPMHPKIAQAVREFRLHHGDMDYVAFSQCWHTPKRQTLTGITNQFWMFYKNAGLKGCSSHSGRRTFITNLSKVAGKRGFSLRDVQLLAGHARLETTQEYIEPSENMAKLIGGLK